MSGGGRRAALPGMVSYISDEPAQPDLGSTFCNPFAATHNTETQTNLPADLENPLYGPFGGVHPAGMDWPPREASTQLLLDADRSPLASHEAPLLDTHAFMVPASWQIPSVLNVNFVDEVDVPQQTHGSNSIGLEAVAGAKGKGTGAKRAAHGTREAEDEDQGVHAPWLRDAVGPKQLYQWSATVGVFLVVQVVFGCTQHGFLSLPPAADWCAGLSLLYPLAPALAAHSVPKARPFAAYVLGIGSVLMTCQVAWHWHALVAQFQRDLLLHHPTTRPFHIVNASLASTKLQWVFSSSAFDFLDTATFLIVTLQNCLQSSFVSPVGVKTTATVSGVQSVILILWPLTSPGMHEAWACRVAVSVVWTAYLVYASHVAESTCKRESQLWDDLCAAVQALEDGRRADSMLNHILKNNMAEPQAPLLGDGTRPALSDGLGLRDIHTVANACGMEAALWQDEGGNVILPIFMLLMGLYPQSESRVQKRGRTSRPWSPKRYWCSSRPLCPGGGRPPVPRTCQ